MEKQVHVRTNDLFAECLFVRLLVCCSGFLSATSADFGVKIEECLYDSTWPTILLTT